MSDDAHEYLLVISILDTVHYINNIYYIYIVVNTLYIISHAIRNFMIRVVVILVLNFLLAYRLVLCLGCPL